LCFVAFIITGMYRLFSPAPAHEEKNKLVTKTGVYVNPLKARKNQQILKPLKKFKEEKDQVRNGENFANVLARHNFSSTDTFYIAEAIKSDIDLRKIASGTPLVFATNNKTQQIERIKIRATRKEWVIAIKSTPKKWTVTTESIHPEIRVSRPRSQSSSESSGGRCRTQPVGVSPSGDAGRMPQVASRRFPTTSDQRPSMSGSRRQWSRAVYVITRRFGAIPR